MKKFYLTLATIVCSAALVLSNSVSAQAASTLPKPTVTKTTTVSFYLKWKAVSKANHYQVQYSTNKDFKKSKTEDKYNSRYVGPLTQNTTYYTKYRAVYKNKSKISYSKWSASTKVKTQPRFPTKFSTSYKKKLNGVTINWTKSDYAQKYRVMVADNKGMNINAKNYYTTKRTFDLKMNSKDGQPKYVRVFSYNADYMRYSNERMLIKPSTIAVGKGEKITLATQNLLCVTCSVDNKPTPKFKDRAPLLLNDVKKYNPDLYLMQEGSNTKDGEKVGQQTGFYNSLKSYGYSFNTAIEDNGTYGDKNRVAFKKDKYTKVTNGRFGITQEGRSVVWVLLKSKSTGKQFYVVATHISPHMPVKDRIKDAEYINTQLAKINKNNYPIFLGGDMNSTPNDTLGNTNSVYIKGGWNDSASATKESNAKYGTYNLLGKNTMVDSYGRIDYLYSKNTGGWSDYKNVISVDSKGRITSKHGSDHNLIVGTSTIG